MNDERNKWGVIFTGMNGHKDISFEPRPSRGIFHLGIDGKYTAQPFRVANGFLYLFDPYCDHNLNSHQIYAVQFTESLTDSYPPGIHYHPPVELKLEDGSIFKHWGPDLEICCRCFKDGNFIPPGCGFELKGRFDNGGDALVWYEHQRREHPTASFRVRVVEGAAR